MNGRMGRMGSPSRAECQRSAKLQGQRHERWQREAGFVPVTSSACATGWVVDGSLAGRG